MIDNSLGTAEGGDFLVKSSIETVSPATTIKLLNTIAQYFMFRKVLIDILENTLFCPM